MLAVQESAGRQELRDVDLPLLEVEEQAVHRLAIRRPEGVEPTGPVGQRGPMLASKTTAKSSGR